MKKKFLIVVALVLLVSVSMIDVQQESSELPPRPWGISTDGVAEFVSPPPLTIQEDVAEQIQLPPWTMPTA